MTISRLIESFSRVPTLPIRAIDVRDWIVNSGIQDEIYMIQMDSDPNVLRGMCHQYTRHEGVYAPPILVSDVYYSKNQCLKWQNFICTKELIHILDKPSLKTAERDEVLALTDALSKPLGSPELGVEDFKAKYDMLMSYAALAILLPEESRLKLVKPYRLGRLSDRQISDETLIPNEYVPTLMNPKWGVIYELLMGF